MELKQTNLVFCFNNNSHNGEPVYKNVNLGIFCLADGSFVFRRHCMKKADYEKRISC